jgi:hypothetical protein
MSKPKRYPVELRERSVRLALEQPSTHESPGGHDLLDRHASASGVRTARSCRSGRP